MDTIKFYSYAYDQEIIGYNDYIFNYIKNSNTLWESKLWEFNLCNLIVDNINNKEFIDIGANIGLMTLGVNKIAQNRVITINKIHCFECDINTFQYLVDNTKIISNKNNNKNNNYIKLYPFALSNNVQLCMMSENSYNRGCNFIYKTINDKTSNNYNYEFIPTTNYYEKRVHIPSFPLDDIIYQFNNVGVIKIDVEGFEYFVLQGAHNTINKYKPIIIVEIWDVNLSKVFDLMQNIHNYTLELIGEQNYICRPNK